MTTTVLTDEQIDDALESIGPDWWDVSPVADRLYARAIEQAVLQSEQVQTWKRDSARYREVRKMSLRQFSEIYQANLQTGAPFDLLVDAAMEKQP